MTKNSFSSALSALFKILDLACDINAPFVIVIDDYGVH